MNPETTALLKLSLLPELGRQRLHSLIRKVGSGEKVLGLEDAELRTLRVSDVARKVLRSGLASRAVEEEIRKAEEMEIEILSPADEEYSEALRQIPDPPAILYVRGRIELLQSPCVALVGSRKCSSYGSEMSLKLGGELAGYGLTVVSGMARGIDSKAHRGSLAVGGNTIAVLGCGVDVVYPREHRRLYDEILEKGCLVSEFPIGSYPAPQNFPVRNRIISGLSQGTIIAEASQFSGSMITARLTLEQDRELWAIPACLTISGGYGPNHLIKQGAHILLTAQDVLDQLRPDVLQQLLQSNDDGEENSDEKEAATRLTRTERAVLKLLDTHRPRHIDELLESGEVEAGELNHALFALELKGLVRQAPGRRFHRRIV